MDKQTYTKWMAARTKHGGYLGGKERPEHYVWRSMLARCCNANHPYYSYYGGRGIQVCAAWMQYEAFFADVGPRPSAEHSLDRIDNDGNYEPGNVRWATKSEQQRNKTTTKLYSNGHFCGTLVDCARYLGLSKELAHWRWKTWNTFEKGNDAWHLVRKD